MNIFGLTGGIACGKSTVAQMLAELGAMIIDADRIGHELLRSPEPAFREVVQQFGPDVLNAAGEIDRKRLGQLVFSDAAKLSALDAILHPKIIERIEELAFPAQDPRAVVVVDAALIFEAGIAGRFRKVIVAWCRPEQQVERLMAKAALSRQDAQHRIAAQMPVDEKRRRADYVIDCSNSKEAARAQVKALYPELRQLVLAPRRVE